MICGHCKCEKGMAFHKDKSRKSGYDCYCCSCRKEIHSASYGKDREHKKSLVKAWVKAHPDKHAAYVKSWEAANKDHVNAYRARWTRANPASRRATEHKRRQAEGEFTPQEWLDLCTRYGNVCLACGETKPLTVDHVIPVSKGGSNYIDNIQPLCLTCNQSKGVKSVDYRTAHTCS